MGTVKYSGPVASFHCPTNAEIRSLKVHFSPKQLGSGDPSPENVREIVGWDGVVVHNDDGVVVPEEYQKIEYLQSTGTQYFWTDINIQDGLTVDSIQTAIQQDSYLFGGISSGGGRTCFNGTWHTTVQGSYPSTYYNISSIIVYNKIHHIITTHKDGRRIVIVDGNTVSDVISSNGITDTQDKCVCFGARKGDGTVFQFYSGNLYSLKVLKNNTLLANFVPCRRKSDNKPGMYDTVTQTFFTNQGTGEFISGPDVGQTTNYEFGVLGKNKLDVSAYIDNEYVKSDGTFDTNNSFRRTDYLHLSPGDYIYSSVKNDSVAVYSRVCGYTKDKTFVSMLNEQLKNSGNYAMTFTVPDNVYYIVLQSYKNTSQEQLELGSIATTYEPYDPNHTVYGGWVDLIAGEVVATHGRSILTGSEQNWTWSTSSNGIAYLIISDMKSGTWYTDDGALCDGAIKTNKATSGGLKCLIGYNNNKIYIYNSTTEIQGVTDLESFQTWLSTHNITITYPIATPNTYHLAPTQLQTFLGQNNVWSNADYVEVEYDLHETQDILARKQFIMANQPHIVTPAATPLQKFVTDVPAPLKECEVHFGPVQEGTGDPSLENVRTISGWNKLTLSLNRAPLPEEYQEVEYIQAQNNYSYFITDYYPNSNTNYYLKIQYSSSGGFAFSTNGDYDLIKNAYYGWTCKKGSGSYTTSALTVFRYLMEMELNGQTFKRTPVNGTTSTSTLTSYEAFQSSSPLIIFATKVDDEIKNSSNGIDVCQIYRFILYENSIKVRDYIPCYRKSDNEPGLYDIINNTFLTKSGEGGFDVGPNITTGTLVTIDWVNEIDTIYGGYVNLITGEIWKTYHKIVADGTNVVVNSSYMTNDVIAAGIVYLNPTGLSCTDSNVLYKGKASNVFTDTIPIYSAVYANRHSSLLSFPYATATTAGSQYIVFKIANRADYPEVTDATTCKAFVNAWLQEHPVTIIYELKIPELVTTLTPTQLKTLRGTNNIWANNNGGNIDLSYWKH